MKQWEVLKFTNTAGGYRDEDVFNIRNRGIILEFIEFIREKITQKISDIELKLME
ncbi:MAG: hypothetical protein LBN24_12070 [Mediterranea sp.]|nr:hypothetical protein [Mediterranea sp.]